MSGDVRQLSLHVIQLDVKRPSQRIYSQQIHATVSDKCRAGGESIQCPLQAGAWCPTLRTAPFGWSANRACRICQVEEVGALSFIQLQCLSEAVERSEEHTSELQSRFDLVCRLLLEKKNKT